MSTPRLCFCVAIMFALLLSACGSEPAAPMANIEVLSGRTDMVSGGDALVQITVDDITLTSADVHVLLNGKEITEQLAPLGNAGVGLKGLVTGLQKGENQLEVFARDSETAIGSLAITNFPATGPILSGPHITPFVCTTQAQGLGEALDENCSAPTKIDYFYRSTADDEFKPLANPRAELPGDVASVTDVDGNAIPYIVRVESGVLNRAIYRIAVLDDVSNNENGWQPDSAWNRRLAVSFGGGCGTNYNQGQISMASALDNTLLSRGFANIVSSQTVLRHRCNDALSGEALMMLKEHFVERYGIPVWTLGSGGSGGAIQQLLLAQNFPGLLDGLLPSASFPDSFSVRAGVTDCRLLMNYFADSDFDWTAEKRQAVEGYSPGTCAAWDRSFIDVIVADKGCGIDESLVYDRETNPDGARCTIYDTNVATVGRDPETGYARQALDNVGVQYGLSALREGIISKAEFLDLNAKVGGYDRDGKVVASRTEAQVEGLGLAYQAGRINTAGGGLGSVPILHFRTYTDAIGDIHDRMRDFSIRERLRKAYDRADNQVIWIYGDRELRASVGAQAVDTMTQWLDALHADTSDATALEKIVRAKPAAARDACWDADGQRIDEDFEFDGPGRCNALYPSHTNPRIAAGATLADDAVKCTLKPVNSADYPVELSTAELAALQDIFPAGVCDYSRAGVAQTGIVGTYLTLPVSSPSLSE